MSTGKRRVCRWFVKDLGSEKSSLGNKGGIKMHGLIKNYWIGGNVSYLLRT